MLEPRTLNPCDDDAGDERFGRAPNEGRVAELEALQEFLVDAVAAFDAEQATIVAPLDRMKRLLQAKDKRTTLLEMAGEQGSWALPRESSGPV